VATALLGLTWGVIYLRRRSIVAPVVSHAGYNALQIVQVLTLRELGS
jgi:membrane protease YdiL (CAAX protease family)